MADSDNEFALISRYFAGIGFTADSTVVGPGDDCAVIAPSPGEELCASIDTLVAGVHFPADAAGDLVAHRSFGAAVSDLAAMGAEPFALTGALTFPAVDHAWLQSFADSWASLSEVHRMPLVGGNLARGPLSVTVNVLGTVPAGRALLRSGAGAGDGVFVTGNPGNAGGGLRLLGREAAPLLRDAYAAPTPRVSVGVEIRNLATAAIDVSDGLLADAGHLTRSSQCRIDITSDSMPLSDELVAAFGPKEALQIAMTAGDDYELLFTAPVAATTDLARIAGLTGVAITQVGQVHEGAGVTVDGAVPDFAAGYTHF